MSLLCMLVDIQEVLSYLIVPLFLGVGIFLTIKTGFLQLRAFPKFLRLLRRKEGKVVKGAKTINPLHAFFVSLSTTIGTGNIMGPSVAIVTGGPGALFWMVAYAFFAGVIKFAEVSFAIHTRTKTEDGRIIGGPTQYLKLVHRWLANWYGYLMIGVLAVWSGVQTNNIANILAKEGIPVWQTGLFVAIFVFIILGGGAKRVGMFASKLVPIMGFSYLAFASFILLKNLDSLKFALSLVFSSAFSPAAAVGGFLGASVFRAMSVGFSKSAFSSEAGLGTSSITHAVANVKKPTDQGILALYGVAIDAIFAIVLVCTPDQIASTIILTTPYQPASQGLINFKYCVGPPMISPCSVLSRVYTPNETSVNFIMLAKKRKTDHPKKSTRSTKHDSNRRSNNVSHTNGCRH